MAKEMLYIPVIFIIHLGNQETPSPVTISSKTNRSHIGLRVDLRDSNPVGLGQ